MSAATKDRADAYAAALLEVARAEGDLERVEDELYQVARLIQSNDQLRSTLTDQAVPVEMRQGVVEQLLGAKASPVTTSLVSWLVGAGRAKDIPDIVTRLVDRSADARGEVVAEVRSAVPLDGDQQTRLAAALSASTGKKVAVKVVIDPSVLGGLRAELGDTVIDGTVRSRLNQLREIL